MTQRECTATNCNTNGQLTAFNTDQKKWIKSADIHMYSNPDADPTNRQPQLKGEVVFTERVTFQKGDTIAIALWTPLK